MRRGTGSVPGVIVRPRAPRYADRVANSTITHLSDDALPRGERLLVVLGEGRIDRYPLPAGVALTAGREPGCEVVLPHAEVSRRHATFHSGPPLEIEDLGSKNGIRVAGQRVPSGARQLLDPGDSVQLGPFTAVVLDAARESLADAPRLAALRIADPTPEGVPEIASRIAQAGISVLIVGETGAGKEVLAQTLHQLSGRSGPLVAVNCAALSESLLESELFGHERGAFTGATMAKPGLFEVAGGGTVFLDEIGELPAALQAKLLRALETREVYRLGGVEPVRLDVRWLSATHLDLAAEVAAGRFRRDFLFRINGITLAIAPLRDRRHAIAPLAERMLADAARAQGRPAPRLGASARAALLRHDWPGNVRELRTVMERAMTLATRDELGAADILFDRVPAADRGDPGEPADGRSRLAAAAAAHRGNVTSIARALGTSRSQVRRLARRYGIDLARYR